jgi:hypothetical protein
MKLTIEIDTDDLTHEALLAVAKEEYEQGIFFIDVAKKELHFYHPEDSDGICMKISFKELIENSKCNGEDFKLKSILTELLGMLDD